MLQFLAGPLLGLLALSLFTLNTLAWCPLIYLFTLPRLLLPWRRGQDAGRRLAMAAGNGWLVCARGIMRLCYAIDYDVQGGAALRPDQWYLVISNHRSWVDIMLIVAALTRRLPFPKFFAKQELLWVPFIGFGMWALEFPLMKRYSAETLAKKPQLRGRDLAATRRACQRSLLQPVALFNFLEGTRNTPAKHAAQSSPYRHLLKPKAGGFAYVLAAMQGRIRQLVDLTIVYPEGVPSFWGFLCGRLRRVRVRVTVRPVPEAFHTGDYLQDAAFRKAFRAWVEELWQAKDAEIDALLESRHPEGHEGEDGVK